MLVSVPRTFHDRISIQLEIPGNCLHCITILSPFRYQDTHNQSCIMVAACERWLGVRVAILSSFFIGSVALGAVLVSQDAGKRISQLVLGSWYPMKQRFGFLMNTVISLIRPSLSFKLLLSISPTPPPLGGYICHIT